MKSHFLSKEFCKIELLALCFTFKVLEMHINLLFVFLGSRLVYLNMYGGISVFDAKTRMTKEVLDNATFVSKQSLAEQIYTASQLFQRTLNSAQFTMSADQRHILIVHDSRRVFRYSAISKYTIQSLENKYYYTRVCTN